MTPPSTRFQLAQANIALMRAELDDPVMADFTAQLDQINALAEESPGYVWRFQTEEGDATAIRVFDDKLILFNMSVWTSPEALFEYTYKSGHVGLLSNRKAWFRSMEGSQLVLWWIPPGHEPTVEEAQARLNTLTESGPTQQAFTFAKTFPPPDDESPG